ncbi:NUDIX domain-containing protein [Streptosporangium soli]|nr:NUDIX domain-containing protein [Streptosporangium sp. KLBMP 9127]
MPISPFLAALRVHVGNALLVLPSACACVFDDQGRLLLARHERGVWAPPGGAIEPDERPADAAVREVAEEVGLKIGVDGLVGTWGGPEFRVLYPNGDQVSYVMSVYACHPLSGDPTPDGDEIFEARYVAEDDLAGYGLASWTALVLPDVFAWHRANAGR